MKRKAAPAAHTFHAPLPFVGVHCQGIAFFILGAAQR